MRGEVVEQNLELASVLIIGLSPAVYGTLAEAFLEGTVAPGEDLDSPM